MTLLEASREIGKWLNEEPNRPINRQAVALLCAHAQGDLRKAQAHGLSDEEIDSYVDAVLRAAGSALRHYTMQKSRDDLRAAMRAAIAKLLPASSL